MPELPEVETVVRTLSPFYLGQNLQEIKVYWPRIVQGRLGKAWQNQKVRSFKRRAKFMLLEFDEGYVSIHLRMTGQLIPRETLSSGKPPHVHAMFVFSGQVVLFQDVRKFGRLRWISRADFASWDKSLGQEPLEKTFTADWLYSSGQKRRRILKSALLDQTWIAGLGNIYVDEALFVAQLHPARRAVDLTRQETIRLHKAIQKVLRKATAANGTSFMDFKFLGGQKGGYTEELLVFRKTGLPCPRCGSPIQRLVLAGRSTHLCTVCQK